MRADPIGLYIHIPFCLSKCKYCDFASFPHMTGWDMEAYTGRICEELEFYRREEKIKVDSIFFGGGTPSLLPPVLFKRIVNKLQSVFNVSDDTEFTVEINPKTTSLEVLDVYKACGVNRISVGLQSVHENELKALGRIHSYNDFCQTVDMLRCAGFENISADLMYGIPEQTLGSFEQTLRTVLNFNLSHISVYGLIIEEGTPFYLMRDSLDIPDTDEECCMYELACRVLGDAGYRHYEISNYSKPGSECKHNLKYWQGKEYIGVGLSAFSYFCGVRYGNSKNWQEYSEGTAVIPTYKENIDIDSEKYEYVMLGLRLSSGVSFQEYQKRFGEDFRCGREALLDRLHKAGYISITDQQMNLTDRGFYLSNSILTELL